MTWLEESAIETITELTHAHSGPGTLWSPVVGSEGMALLDRINVDPQSRDNLIGEAVSVLAHCIPPTEHSGQSTGLVVGYVQSGKTASFTTVATLAKDNGYRLVIVLSGLTTNLFDQSFDRLENDLRTGEGRKRWLSIANPTPDDFERISKALSTPPGPNGARVVLLTVMKNRAHLDHLTGILERLSIQPCPALIIDDEADQASLNNEIRKGGQSATYRRLLKLRNELPHHTYLQYTATPQGPLLINIIDTLSPRFVVVLTPGESYTGGEEFFAGHLNLVREIPTSDLPNRDDEPDEPPESLLQALRMFYLGVAAGLVEGNGEPTGNRSMMIHPSSRQAFHAVYHRWARAIGKRWADVIRDGLSDPVDPDYLAFRSDIEAAYRDLTETIEDAPPLEELWGTLLESIEDTVPLEVNSSRGSSPQPNWNQHYSHIITGGDILNRGFTIEGLTVSYMPRSLGTGQADTIQQRARWFGYKEDYLGYCRVYLSSQARKAYEGYIDHEGETRKSLREYAATGKDLAGWKRVFFLSRNLQPTRRSILDSDYSRGNFQDKWFRTRAPHQSEGAIEGNRALVRDLRTRYEDLWQIDPGSDTRSAAQKHLWVDQIPLEEVYTDFLIQFSCPNSADSAELVGLMLQVGVYLEKHPGETCAIYLIRQGDTRERSLTAKDEINELFQGYDPQGEFDPSKRRYPGDDAIRVPRHLSIQIHNLDLLQNKVRAATNVPALAIWVPKKMGADWISMAES